MYTSFRPETIDTFKQFTKYNSGWKLPLVYSQIRSATHPSEYREATDLSETSITVTWRGFGIGTQTETFDWSNDITSDESSKEKFCYAKRVLMMMILKEMMDTPDEYSLSDWDTVLGI